MQAPSLKGCLCVSHSLIHKRTAGNDNKGALIQLWGNEIRLQKKFIWLMLASPAPVRTFVCAIRKT